MRARARLKLKVRSPIEKWDDKFIIQSSMEDQMKEIGFVLMLQSLHFVRFAGFFPAVDFSEIQWIFQKEYSSKYRTKMNKKILDV